MREAWHATHWVSSEIGTNACGGIDAGDRHRAQRFFKCTTLLIGAVPVRPGVFTRPEQVAFSAAAAKHQAKLSSIGVAIEAA